MPVPTVTIPAALVAAANLTHGQFRLYCALAAREADADGWITLRQPYQGFPLSHNSVGTHLNHLAGLGYTERQLLVDGMRVRLLGGTQERG